MIIKSIKKRALPVYYAFSRIIIILRIRFGERGNFPLMWALKYLHIYSVNNHINISSNQLGRLHCYIYGNEHDLVIERGVVFKSGKLWFEDNKCAIRIKKGTTIEEAEIAVAENNTHISIGCDCMLSSGIRISTTDSHSIIDTETNQRINPAQSVTVDNHVWIGRNVSISKGVHVYQNSIIGANSFVTHDVRSNSVVAGIPARVLKEGVNWDRERK